MRGRATRGFTLIEVLLALAISVLLSAAVLSLLFNLGRRRTAMIRLASDQQSAGVFLDRLESDLSTALAGDEELGAGVKGTATELALLSRGVLLQGAGTARGLGDLQGSRYLFDPEAGALKARRWSAGRGSGESGDFEVISSRMSRVRFRYFDGRAWKESFDSVSERALPVAVECAIWAGNVPPPEAGTDIPPGAPDRVRVIVIPDGPSAPWKEER
jgi:prepilin-type N-terminal cleavage/methylation domain-containing protein